MLHLDSQYQKEAYALEAELPNERHRLPVMAERIWNPNTGHTYEQFARRAQATDQLLDLLVHQFTVSAEGLVSPTENRFHHKLRLRLGFASNSAPAGQSPEFAKRTIHYTLDGKEPTTNSPSYGPSRLIFLGNSMKVKAALFRDGKKQGETWSGN